MRYLRDLLCDEVEFGAKYPEAYELLFERSEVTSFGWGLVPPIVPTVFVSDGRMG